MSFEGRPFTLPVAEHVINQCVQWHTLMTSLPQTICLVAWERRGQNGINAKVTGMISGWPTKNRLCMEANAVVDGVTGWGTSWWRPSDVRSVLINYLDDQPCNSVCLFVYFSFYHYYYLFNYSRREPSCRYEFLWMRKPVDLHVYVFMMRNTAISWCNPHYYLICLITFFQRQLFIQGNVYIFLKKKGIEKIIISVKLFRARAMNFRELCKLSVSSCICF